MGISIKQKEFIENANNRYNLKVGARRCGKSYLDVLYRIPKKTRELSGAEGLSAILGVSKSTIERNVLKPMREIYGSKLVGNINSNNIAFLFGEEYYCLGAEKISQVSKIQGTSIKYVYADELAKFHRDVFEMVKGSLDKEYSCMDGALNPENLGHWLKKDFIDKIEADNLDVFIQNYTIFDNPFLPKSFVDNFVKEMKSAGTAWYNRLVLGEWCNAEGLIYPMTYESNVYVEPRDIPSIEEFHEFAISCDYGTSNTTAFLLSGRIGKVWYVIDEYGHSGRETGQQKTDEQYYLELCKFASKVETSTNKRVPVIIDPSALSFITTIKHHGKFVVVKADNDVINGIRNTASSIYKGKLKISKNCVKLKAELDGYVWDDKSIEDKPLKVNDHFCDSLRYFCQTKKIHQDYKEWIF